MQILFLAPHPFYQDRGSPIAVAKLLEVMSARGEHIDMVTFNGGRDVEYDNLTIYRTPDLLFLRNIRPGFSYKKVISDLFMLLMAFRLALRKRYQIIYAVEESVYLALWIKALLKIPYVYDMDSSLAEQMVEQYPVLRLILPVLYWFEKIAVRNAKAVVPVCDVLAWDIARYSPKKVVILHDVSLFGDNENHKEEKSLSHYGNNKVRIMYVGNLQKYQGINLLFESLALALEKTEKMDLVIIGGGVSEIKKHRKLARRLGIHRNVTFLGPRSVEDLGANLAQADVLVSPRIKGNATPMKIYSYLDSGKPVLATDLPTHTQILNDQSALLADPSPEAFSMGMVQLVEDYQLRERLGMAGKKLIEEKYSYVEFHRKAQKLFDWLDSEFDTENAFTSPISPSTES